jgi:hypothetical protein
MDDEKKSTLVRQYFEAMDDTDPEVIRPRLAAGFTYVTGGGTTLTGRDAIAEYIEEVRTLADTFHDIEHSAHGTSASFAEGTVTGEDPDGNGVSVGFCDVFEFDEEKGTIEQITVYINER